MDNNTSKVEETTQLQANLEGLDLNEEILKLQEQINSNPYIYENHTKLIELCKAQNDSEMLNLARTQMRLYFPLTEALWIDWIQDSLNDVFDDDSFQNCLNLFDWSLSDYMMISICQLKAQFIIDQNSKDVISLSDARSMLDQTNFYCELHPQSELVWDLIYEFEEKTLQEDPSLQNVDRMKNLMFHRISIPHSNLTDIFEKYSPFITEHFNEFYEDEMLKANSICSKAKNTWQTLETYESSLVESNNDWSKFIPYINFVRYKLKDKIRVINLYERAVFHNPLLASAWESYIEFISSESEFSESMGDSICQRSVKNCPWNADLWIIRLQNSEGMGYSLDDLEAIFGQGISYGSIQLDVNELTKLFIERCGYVKRKFNALEDIPQLSTTLDKCLQEYYHYAPQGDNTFRLEKLISRIQVQIFNQGEKANEIWSNTTKQFKNYTNAWLGHIDYERHFGELDQVRDLYIKASRSLTDWPEVILSSWLEFEAIYGDIGNVQKARHMVYIQRQKILQAQEKALVEQVEVQAREEAKKERLREKDRKNKAKIRASNKNKRAAEFNNHESSDVEVENKKIKETHDHQPRKPIVLITNISESITENDLELFFSDCGTIEQIQRNATNAYITFKHPLALESAQTKNNATIQECTISVTLPHIVENNNVLYVSNFSEASMDELKSLFSPYGSLIQIRLPAKRQGSNRGFAYVHFERDEDANMALKENGSRLNGMELYVALSNPSRKNNPHQNGLQQVDYSKVFVGNIPSSMTKPDLDNLFKQYGPVKNINLLPPKNDGACVAFVDFVSQESGQAALATNSYQVEGHILNVVTCDPNRKKKNKPSDNQFNNGSQKDLVPKKPLTQFVPRASRPIAKPKSRLNFSK